MSSCSRDLEATGKLVASRSSGNSEKLKAGSRKWPHIFHVSSSCTPHGEGLFDRTPIYGGSPTDDLNDLDVNSHMEFFLECHTPRCSSSWWRLSGESTIYQESTRKACDRVVPSDWQVDWGSKRNYRSDHNRLQTATWRSTTLSCDKAIEITNANTYVLADSVPCLGGTSTEPVQAWENKIKWCLETR